MQGQPHSLRVDLGPLDCDRRQAGWGYAGGWRACAPRVPRLPILLPVPQRESRARRAHVASTRNRHPKAPGTPGLFVRLPPPRRQENNR